MQLVVLRNDYLGATPRFFIDAQGQVRAHVRASDQPAILDLFTDAVIASERQSPGGTWEWWSVEEDGTEVLLFQV